MRTCVQDAQSVVGKAVKWARHVGAGGDIDAVAELQGFPGKEDGYDVIVGHAATQFSSVSGCTVYPVKSVLKQMHEQCFEHELGNVGSQFESVDCDVSVWVVV